MRLDCTCARLSFSWHSFRADFAPEYETRSEPGVDRLGLTTAAGPSTGPPGARPRCTSTACVLRWPHAGWGPVVQAALGAGSCRIGPRPFTAHFCAYSGVLSNRLTGRSRKPAQLVMAAPRRAEEPSTP